MQVIKVKVFKGRHLKLEAAVLLAALLVGGITTVTDLLLILLIGVRCGTGLQRPLSGYHLEA